MIVDYLLAAAALVVAGAYAGRVGELSWWHTPWLMLMHAGGGSTSIWVLYDAAVREASTRDAFALACAIVLLRLTWSHLPRHRVSARRREVYHTGLTVSGAHIGRRDTPLEPLDRRHDDR